MAVIAAKARYRRFGANLEDVSFIDSQETGGDTSPNRSDLKGRREANALINIFLWVNLV